jgi:catechol 2,3-dioxygenase
MKTPKLHHVTFKTTRLSQMVQWYSLVIGAKVNFENPVAAWTTNDEANHRIAFLAVPGLSDDGSKTEHTGIHHTAFEFDTFADLMAAFDRLREADVEPAFCLDHGLTISIYYRDPDGNFVELQSDCFGDWSLSSEYMRSSPDFAANPIGVFFDPARVYDAFASGSDLRTLKGNIRSGQFLPSPIPPMGLPA